MLYLSFFSFPDIEQEYDFRMLKMRRTCYNSMYPFFILSSRNLTKLKFEPVTIFYGGNGSGKTTALNVIAEKLQLSRDSLYNRSSFFEDYLSYCYYDVCRAIPTMSRIITSDDVFDFMLNVRSLNESIDRKREELFQEYMDAKYSQFQVRSLDDYEQLTKVCEARGKSQSKFVDKRLMENMQEHSNGESGFLYFINKIQEGGLYLLDEPENSLSPEKQLELRKFLEDNVRFFNCQFIIATHSPFLLSLREAKIYDFDADPVDVRKWYELKNVRTYYDFFQRHKTEFES